MGCLFDLSTDESETHNLINESSLADVVHRLTSRLEEAASTGPDWAIPLEGPLLHQIEDEICKYQERTSYYEPQRDSLPSSPSPAPSPDACRSKLVAVCPPEQFKSVAT